MLQFVWSSPPYHNNLGIQPKILNLAFLFFTRLFLSKALMNHLRTGPANSPLIDEIYQGIMSFFTLGFWQGGKKQPDKDEEKAKAV
ncbi:MAG: hypothetical protein H0X47_15495 [Nitrospirales bacterium]|nr:hypothetical protein [Nitrospirales bacterium]